MLMSKPEFVNRVFQIAQAVGYPVTLNGRSYRQIDFGHKQLHEEHLQRLYPSILGPDARIGKLIDEVAPGRPCTHKPLRLIIEQLTGGHIH